MNREQWLNECIQKLRPDFEQLGHPLPEKIRASCSWPSKSGLANKKRRIGEAWSAKNSADRSCEVFISPVLKDPLEVAATLVHELVHCAVGVEEGHKGKFTRLAKAIGLEGKMTATHAGETLKARLQTLKECMQAGSETMGFYREGMVYFKEDIATAVNKYLLQTALEEAAHYVTGATDMSRDFQNFLIQVVVAIKT